MPGRILIAALVILVLSTSGEVAAQSTPHTDQAASRLLRTSGVRAAAMGNAFGFTRRAGWTGGPEADGIFVHPASMRFVSGLSVTTGLLPGSSTLLGVASGRPFMGGHLAIGFRAMSSTSSALTGVLAYARSVFGLDVGVSAKLVDERAGGEHASVVAVDAGLAHDLAGFNLALSVRNLGPGLRLPAGSEDLPTDVEFGASTDPFELGPLDVQAAASVVRRRDGDWMPGGGLEISWWPVVGRTFSGRIGARRTPKGTSPLTLGLGFTGDSIGIDYAWQPGDEPDGGHRIGLIWQ